MKALVIDAYGLDNVKVAEVADPAAPGPNEAVVRLEAAALNHLDIWTLTGVLDIPHEFPHVLGADGAGRIESVGSEVRGFKKGDQVVVNPGLSCRECELCRRGEQSICTTFKLLGEHVPGTFAERIKVPALNLFPFPEHLSFGEAAALGVTFVTAYRMLFTRGRLRPGEWVLITGIGGGLALSVLQLALPVAGRILVTSSSQAKIDRAVELGAEAGVNYKEEDVSKWVRHETFKRGVDLVVDSAGGQAFESGLRSVRKGGRLVSAGATAGRSIDFDIRRIFWNQLSVLGSTMGSDEDMADMLRAVGGTKLRPIIDRSFVLDQGVEALRYLESGDRFGKVVLELT
jgi:NADPH:quinone reductase-like Zn-dependent oxidoreductase